MTAADMDFEFAGLLAPEEIEVVNVEEWMQFNAPNVPLHNAQNVSNAPMLLQQSFQPQSGNFANAPPYFQRRLDQSRQLIQHNTDVAAFGPAMYDSSEQQMALGMYSFPMMNSGSQSSEGSGTFVSPRQQHVPMNNYSLHPGPELGINQLSNTHAHQLSQGQYRLPQTPLNAPSWQPANVSKPAAQPGHAVAESHFPQQTQHTESFKPQLSQEPQQSQRTKRKREIGSNESSPSGNARTAIPSTNRTVSRMAQLKANTVQAGGPVMNAVVLPPPQKPGRKPLPADVAADKRREQNREAQRTFRDKRQQKLLELQDEIAEQKQNYENTISDMERQHHDSREKLCATVRRAEQRAEAAEQRAEAAEQRIKKLEQQLQHLQNLRAASQNITAPYRVSASSGPSLAVEPSPPQELSFETDFTNYGRSQNDAEPPHCGFCSDKQNCVCSTQKLAPTALDYSAATPNTNGTTMPGSCEACLLDPERAKACRDLASSAQMSYRTLPVPVPSTTAGSEADAALGSGRGPFDNSAKSGAPSTLRASLPPMAMPPPRVSCSAMVDEFNRAGKRTSSFASIFPGPVDAYPRPNGGFEFEEHQAAEVLSTLSSENRSSVAPEQAVDHNSHRGSISMFMTADDNTMMN